VQTEELIQVQLEERGKVTSKSGERWRALLLAEEGIFNTFLTINNAKKISSTATPLA